MRLDANCPKCGSKRSLKLGRDLIHCYLCWVFYEIPEGKTLSEALEMIRKGELLPI